MRSRNCRTPGFSVLHYLLQFAQTHVDWVSDATISSISPPSPPPSIFPSIRVFYNESVLSIRWPKYWSLASVSVLLVNIQGWFPLGLTGLISLQSQGLVKVSSTTIRKHQFFGTQPSLLWSTSHIRDYWKNLIIVPLKYCISLICFINKITVLLGL